MHFLFINRHFDIIVLERCGGGGCGSFGDCSLLFSANEFMSENWKVNCIVELCKVWIFQEHYNKSFYLHNPPAHCMVGRRARTKHFFPNYMYSRAEFSILYIVYFNIFVFYLARSTARAHAVFNSTFCFNCVYLLHWIWGKGGFQFFFVNFFLHICVLAIASK